MLTELLICFISSLVMGVIAYLVTTKLSFMIITFLSFFLTLFIVIRPLLIRYIKKERIRHETYKFINSFIINLSVSNSFDKAFASAKDGLGEEFNEIVKKVNGNSRNVVFYLTNYFDSNVYSMFLNILNLFEEQGGDILDLSRNLLLEVARIEDSGNIKEKEDARSIKEFLTMWAFALVIFLFMRFGLSSFFDFLKANIVFLVGVGVFLAFFLFSTIAYSFALLGRDKKRKNVVNEGIK